MKVQILRSEGSKIKEEKRSRQLKKIKKTDKMSKLKNTESKFKQNKNMQQKIRNY